MPQLNIKRTLKGLALAYLLESLVLYLGAGLTIYTMIIGKTTSLIADLALLGLLLGAALWLTFASKAILKGKRWGRSAGVFWQLIQIVIAFGTFEANWLAATAITLLSLAVLVTLFQKDVVQATLESN
ncbi:MAG: hypothetical protein RIQ88_232 [Actinomycetota bacterium]|jgi:hypothetical protein